MLYRLAEEQDARKLSELRWVFKQEGKSLDTAGKDGFIDHCTAFLQERLNKNWFCWLAEENGVIVSCVHIELVEKLPKPSKPTASWGYITNMYTLPHLRNKGIGGELMERAKAWGKAYGLERFVLWPSVKSAPYYARAGFTGDNDILELML